MNVIILGDKFQKRMKSRGCVGLLKSNNQSLIENQYNNIKHFDNSAQIIYVYGFEAKKFISYLSKTNIKNDIQTIYNKHYDEYNHAYSLYLAQKYLNDDCLIMFGDEVLQKNTFKKLDTSIGSQIFINKEKNKLGCIIHNNEIKNIAYDLDNYLANIYYISKDHALLLQQTINNPQHHNCFIFELFNMLIDHHQTMKPLLVNIRKKEFIK